MGVSQYMSESQTYSCPTGRAYQNNNAIVILPGNVSRLVGYERYLSWYDSLRETMKYLDTAISSSIEPLSFLSFKENRDSNAPVLKILKRFGLL